MTDIGKNNFTSWSELWGPLPTDFFHSAIKAKDFIKAHLKFLQDPSIPDTQKEAMPLQLFTMTFSNFEVTSTLPSLTAFLTEQTRYLHTCKSRKQKKAKDALIVNKTIAVPRMKPTCRNATNCQNAVSL